MIHNEGNDYLPSLTSAFIQLEASKTLSTKAFTDACAKVLPVFDHIGTVFIIAKHEFAGKRDSLVAVEETLTTLEAVVEDGKKSGTICKKNSPGRNLHRLISSLSFISQLFKRLAEGMELRQAVSEAYDVTLAHIHVWVVRTGIKAGMLGLPTRDHFFTSLGETDVSARAHSDGFHEAVEKLVESVSSLYEGVDIPRSGTLSSLWS